VPGCAACLFEEVAPAALLDDRPCENGSRDFLVQWPDGAEDSWARAPRFAASAEQSPRHFAARRRSGTAHKCCRFLQTALRGDMPGNVAVWTGCAHALGCAQHAVLSTLCALFRYDAYLMLGAAQSRSR